MKIRLVMMSTLLVAVIVFAVQNAEIVLLRFLFFQIELPRSLLILLVFLIGSIIGWFSRGIWRVSRVDD